MNDKGFICVVRLEKRSWLKQARGFTTGYAAEHHDVCDSVTAESVASMDASRDFSAGLKLIVSLKTHVQFLFIQAELRCHPGKAVRSDKQAQFFIIVDGGKRLAHGLVKEQKCCPMRLCETGLRLCQYTCGINSLVPHIDSHLDDASVTFSQSFKSAIRHPGLRRIVMGAGKRNDG